MEGFRDIVWQGDQIVWANLFRHYLYCLYLTYGYIGLVGDSKTVEPQEIPVMGRAWESFSEKIAVSGFDDIRERIFEKTHLDDFIAKIVQAKRKARREELLLYLQLLNGPALYEIRGADTTAETASDDERREKSPSVFSHLANILDHAPQIEDERFLDSVFQFFSEWLATLSLGHKSHHKSASKNPWENNRRLLAYDFSGAYLVQLEQVLYPDCYVASFMRDYRNASVWGHYGDGHKGICLIFEADTTTEGNSLTLKQVTGFSTRGERW